MVLDACIRPTCTGHPRFRGSHAWNEAGDPVRTVQVACECGCAGPLAGTEGEAAEAWEGLRCEANDSDAEDGP